MRRVAITGLGLVTPLSFDVRENWNLLMQGSSGIDLIKSFDASDYPVRIAGEVDSSFDIHKWLPPKEAKRYDSFTHYAIAASEMALEDSGLDAKSLSEESKQRFGVCVGSGIGGLETMEKNIIANHVDGYRRVSPFYVVSGIINMASGVISIRHGLKGPNVATVSACTTGSHAIAWAFRMIQCGDADVMVSGGTEQPCTPSGIAGFAATRALSMRNEEPTRASRPWDKDRDGFVLSSGAGILILEEWTHAKKRGAKIYGEIVGIGMNSDASHVTQPSQNGLGASQCMDRALQDAQITPQKIGYINAHGTSTPLGDIAEIYAIKRSFNNHAKQVLISSTKSMIGHPLGAAGAIEGIFSVLSLHHQQIPPTINVENVDDECDLDIVANQGRDATLDYAMSNSFGFGGSNCSVVFAKV